MIRVVLADDQALIRSALATMINLEPDIEVVAQAGDCGAALEAVRRVRPDVILLDVQMPAGGVAAGDGIDVVGLLRKEYPALRVIIVTTFGRPGYLRRALESGAVGFMTKDAPADRLIDAIRRVAQGLRVVDPELAAASLSIGPSPLTGKEREILGLAAQGLTSPAIARQTCLSEGTVRNYLSAAIGKVGGRNRVEAVRIATDNGWL